MSQAVRHTESARDDAFVRRMKVFIAVAAGALIVGGPVLVFLP